MYRQSGDKVNNPLRTKNQLRNYQKRANIYSDLNVLNTGPIYQMAQYRLKSNIEMRQPINDQFLPTWFL